MMTELARRERTSAPRWLFDDRSLPGAIFFDLDRDVHSLAKAAASPLATLASFFAISGPADLILAITPVHKLDKAVGYVRDGRKARKNAKKLKQARTQLRKLLDDDLDAVEAIAAKLGAQQIKALMTIRRETDSLPVTRKLMALTARNQADAAWIVDRMNRGKLDSEFVRRLTFDADLVAEYTEHAAHPSWSTLDNIVKGIPVDPRVRDSLASKVTGLLGERAAADRMREPAFYRRFFPSDRKPPSVGRGLSYGGARSLDLVAYGGDNQIVFAEVKNWSIATWVNQSERSKLLKQLERHNQGIDQFLLDNQPSRKVAGKVLMIRKEGFDMLIEETQKEVKQNIEALGWTLETIPSSRIPDFGDLIDSLR